MEENEKREALKSNEEVLQIMYDKINEKDNAIFALEDKLELTPAEFEKLKQLKKKKGFFRRLSRSNRP